MDLYGHVLQTKDLVHIGPFSYCQILNELIFRGEKSTVVLSMIERQFKLIFLIKLGLEDGKSKESLSSELRLHPYICEKMIMQFTFLYRKNK